MGFVGFFLVVCCFGVFLVCEMVSSGSKSTASTCTSLSFPIELFLIIIIRKDLSISDHKIGLIGNYVS